MRKLYILILVTGLTNIGYAQYTRYVIRFTNKEGTPFTLSNPSAYLSAKAIERRNRQQLTIDSTDLPITPRYLDSIKAVPNVTVLNQSKWFNQVLIKITDPLALNKIRSFSFVADDQPVANSVAGQTIKDSILVNDAKEVVLGQAQETSLQTNTTQQTQEALQYGSMYTQIHIHEGEYLHNNGFTGAGIGIAVLDAGYYLYKTNPALDSLRLQNRINGEWDFVASEQSVNEDHNHGMYCLTVMAANRPGVVVGSAPHASYWLYRTEDYYTEYPVEEQNWVAAAERADSAGADIITTSLGYTSFNDPAFNHSYADRNGNTTLVTKAANLAVKKGMIVTASAGNNGRLTTDEKYVSAPADGDSVLAVGATKMDGTIADFSSWGPNGAGKTKPNVASVGQGTICANTAGNPVALNGTSFSNPNLAGLIACLWQAYPEFNNRAIINAVEKSADKYDNPDNRFGYGIPNFRIAAELLSQQRLLRRYTVVLGNRIMKAYPAPFDNYLDILINPAISGQGKIELLDAAGQKLISVPTSSVAGVMQVVTIPETGRLPNGLYLVVYHDGKNKYVYKVMK